MNDEKPARGDLEPHPGAAGIAERVGDIRGVLFDLDNTLHDRDEAFVEWATEFIRGDIGIVDDTEYRETMELIVALDRGGEGDKARLFRAVIDRHPHVMETAEQLVRRFFDERNRYMRLSENVDALFATVERRGIPWGIVTNGSSEQWGKLRWLKLHHATPCIFVSAEFGCSKPDARIFLAAAKGLDVPPGQILFVGDSPLNDICGAQAVGMRTAWLRRGRTWPAELDAGPDLILDDIGELIGIVEPSAESNRPAS